MQVSTRCAKRPIQDTTALNDASLEDVLWRVDCEFGKISTEQYASTSLGGYNIGATTAFSKC